MDRIRLDDDLLFRFEWQGSDVTSTSGNLARRLEMGSPPEQQQRLVVHASLMLIRRKPRGMGQPIFVAVPTTNRAETTPKPRGSRSGAKKSFNSNRTTRVLRKPDMLTTVLNRNWAVRFAILSALIFLTWPGRMLRSRAPEFQLSVLVVHSAVP